MVALWGSFFRQFSPRHRHYYAFNLGRQLLEAFCLHCFRNAPGAWQPGSVFLVEVAALVHVCFWAPYVLLAQSRAEIFTAVSEDGISQ